jgi:subtilisin family serine protease
VTVAVLDSGVDGSLSELAPRVADGLDVTTSKPGADTDCVGHGTAVAGIIVGQPNQPAPGIAPEATVLPIRVRNSASTPSVSNVARGVDAAVTAGAQVVVMPFFIDLDHPLVRTAIQNAVTRNVLVVTNAIPASHEAATTAPASHSSVLRVGGVSIDGTVVQAYRPGSVDVVAPGVDITVLGVNGVGVFSVSGTEYAVAFVAGLAALVRSAFPSLNGAQVAHRIESTATRLTTTLPDPQFGWGFIDPLAAVSRTIAEENVTRTGGSPNANLRPASTGATPDDGRMLAFGVAVGVIVLAVLVVALRVRRWVTGDVPTQRSERDHDEHAATQYR